MVLARQHQPGGHKTRTDPYEPVCAWADDCIVQWGSRGIVFRRDGGETYETAFFEAFPRDPNTFLRGEGTTLAAAEASAFAQLQRIRACAGHEFKRGSFRNGCGTCTHCHLFGIDVFEPLEECAVCGVKTYYCKHEGQWLCEEHAPSLESVYPFLPE